ncbi:MAG: subclass B3 metallo-beta-lactamase [Xanthomonadaceae bacterium]|nr:subclass B3 metallo-beta-lactamase [Xanthomonadaceae bacterium]
MPRLVSLIVAASLAWGPALAAAPYADVRAEWNAPQAPFRIYGSTYYVGTHGLSAVLLADPAGLILIDGDLPESAPQIAAHIRALGFRVEDIRYILNSHAHFDHAGGIAQLQRLSGAQVVASASGAFAMEHGGVDPADPQAGVASSYPAVRDVRTIADGATLALGALRVTAHYTPGHTPGSTSWTWDACEHGRCEHVVYADSLTAVSADGYRFGDPQHPQRAEDFRRAIATVAALPCDILLTPHPSASNLRERLDARTRGQRPDPLIDANACRAYAATALKNFDARLQRERAPAQ